MNISWITGPLIGAVIGYFTNYIAVKMLFYPKKEIRVFGKRLPFTPGAIPKEKGRIARSIGAIVSSHLLTEEVVKNQLTSSDIEEPIVQKIMDVIEKPIQEQMSGHENQVDTAEKVLSNKIVESLQSNDVRTMIEERVYQILKDKANESLMGYLLQDAWILSISSLLADSAIHLINREGQDLVESNIHVQRQMLEQKSILQICQENGIQKEEIQNKIKEYYEMILEENLSKALSALNVAGIVEDKIDQMSIDEIEDMVLEAMNKELSLIVNLGALIGFVLGLLNLIL